MIQYIKGQYMPMITREVIRIIPEVLETIKREYSIKIYSINPIKRLNTFTSCLKVKITHNSDSINVPLYNTPPNNHVEYLTETILSVLDEHPELLI